MSDGHDDKLSADIRRLIGEDTGPRATAPRQDQPLLLTDPVDDPAAPETGPEMGLEPPPAGIDRSISGTLAKLDAREAGQSANATGDRLTVSNRPVDALVEEALRPLLTEWLDRNLDRIVREQVDAALRAESTEAE
jgi:hypothetical protein